MVKHYTKNIKMSYLDVLVLTLTTGYIALHNP